MMKKEDKLEEILKSFDDHPFMKKLAEDRTAAALTTRRAAGEAIEKLRKEWAEVIPRLQADLAAEEAKYLKAKAALTADLGELQKKKAALSSKRNSFDTDIKLQEQILYETADPRIDEEIQFFRDKLDWLRKPGRINRIGRHAERNIFTLTKTIKEENNDDAVRGALQYCIEAIKELERIKLSPAVDVEKIERMKAGVPNIDVYQEVTGEKPFPRIDTDPRSLFKSDSQMDWELGKLNEKFKKVIEKSTVK